MSLGLVEATLVGDEPTIRAVCQAEKLDPARFTIVQESSDVKAAARAVAMVNAGEAQILMKGLVSSDKYMRAILDKEKGLMDPGAILSHVTVIEVASYPKLIVCGDVAVLPAPELKEKIAMTQLLHRGGPGAGHREAQGGAHRRHRADALQDAGLRGRGDHLEDGRPRRASRARWWTARWPSTWRWTRRRSRSRASRARWPATPTCLVFPSIEAGNVFYKTCTKLAGAELAGLVVGARVPCVLTSRGDTAKSQALLDRAGGAHGAK